MFRLPTSLEQLSWDTTLVDESMVTDIYSAATGTYPDDESKATLPDGIRTNVNISGTNYRTIGLIKNLSGSGVEGRDQQLTNEEDQSVREFQVWSNDFSHAVNTETYGKDADLKSGYKILGHVQPQLSTWHQEREGRYIRESMLERYSSNLVKAASSRTKRWNENIYIKGVALASQPAYNVTPATYENLIGVALNTTTSADTWDQTYLRTLNYWITAVKKLQPMANGRYIVTVPSGQAVALKAIAATQDGVFDGFMPSMLKGMHEDAKAQYLGSFGKMDLYDDPRSPVVKLTGSAPNWVITAYYKDAGDTDDRDGLSGDLFDVGTVHGRGSFCMGEHEKTHFEEEVQNYRKIVGVGAFRGAGFQRLTFDNVGSETTATNINQNSASLFARQNVLTA